MITAATHGFIAFEEVPRDTFVSCLSRRPTTYLYGTIDDCARYMAWLQTTYPTHNTKLVTHCTGTLANVRQMCAYWGGCDGAMRSIPIPQPATS